MTTIPTASRPALPQGSDPAPAGAEIAGARPRPLSVAQVLAAVLVLSCLAFGLGHPLIDQDEGRNAEVGREMAVNDDYVLPTLDGLPYLDKPVLFFAAEAAIMEVLGPTEVAARLPSLLATFATALLVAWFAGRVFGPGRSALAALMFLSAPLTVAFSRIVIFDALLTFFVTAATLCLYLTLPAARGEPVPPRSRLWAVAGWAAIGLGILTKGPVALALPLLAVLPVALRRRSGRRLFTPAALLVFAVVITPWLVAVSLRRPDFLSYALLTETLERVATGKLHRSGPFWIYLPILLIGGFPWSLVPLALFPRRRRERWSLTWNPAWTFTLVWVGAPLVLFTLSNSKRTQYVLPLVAPLALLSADLWVRSEGARRWLAKVAGLAYLGFGLALAAAVLSGAILPRVKPALRPAVTPACLALAAAFLAGGALAFGLRRRPKLQALALAATFLLAPMALGPAFTVVSKLDSTRPLIGTLQRATGAHGRVIFVETYAPSLTFYTRRPTLVVSHDGADLRSNYVPGRYRELLGAPGSTLRSPAWLDATLARCPAGDIFAVHPSGPLRPHLDARLPVLVEHHHLVFYGPCPDTKTADRSASDGLSGPS